MPKFDDTDKHYMNVNEIAEREGLIWDGQYGSPYNIKEMIAKELQDKELLDDGGPYSQLFDHTKRFKPRGSGAKKPVLAISMPYADEDHIRPIAKEFAERFGLECRVGEARDRVYVQPSTVPIAFWRADLHTFVG